jgi:hypothetical protein
VAVIGAIQKSYPLETLRLLPVVSVPMIRKPEGTLHLILIEYIGRMKRFPNLQILDNLQFWTTNIFCSGTEGGMICSNCAGMISTGQSSSVSSVVSKSPSWIFRTLSWPLSVTTESRIYNTHHILRKSFLVGSSIFLLRSFLCSPICVARRNALHNQ